MLWRGAFAEEADGLSSAEADVAESGDETDGADEEEEWGPWPTWEEVAELCLDEEAESRIISHVPGDDRSWTLELGPFDRDLDDSCRFMFESSRDARSRMKRRITAVVNDVDRFHPPLSDWLSSTFSFVPRWRLDDAQISLSEKGGGIGPHVDDYDVVLIQAAGTRTWEVGRRLVDREEEFARLVDGLDVRILSGWGAGRAYADGDEDRTDDGAVTYELQPGDALYLPPRVAHRGTATSDGCVTLSVGFRAPSAYDLVSRVAETMGADEGASGAAASRYADPDLLDDVGGRDGVGGAGNEITADAKERAKSLVLSAVSDLLDDPAAWDDFVGRAVTESKRVRLGYPPTLDELDDECRGGLGAWGHPEEAVPRS